VLGLKLAVALFVLSTPVLGVWTASSLSAYAGKSQWLPIAGGLLAFPLAPLGWDAFSEYRRKRKGDARPRILTFGDRLLVRTFLVNFVWLLGLLLLRPSTAFAALSTRGDWMLDGRHGPLSERARGALFSLAGRLEWLHSLSHENPYAKLVDDSGARASEDVKPAPRPEPTPAPVATTPAPTASGSAAPPAPAAATEARTRWPLPAELHPLVREIPSADESSFESVAKFIGSREPDPARRIKALHDYVADRVAYDAVALAEQSIPPQDAARVFGSKKAVCAGYANLLRAMAKITGDEVVVVVGDARTDVDAVGGGGHAWNAVKLDGRWHLVDATWDAGTVSGREFEKRYTTNYFLTPPEVFGVDHFPEDPRFQLRDPPLSRGDFMRQPMLRAPFYVHGFRLERPDRSQVSVGASFDAELDNPRGVFVLASFAPKGAPRGAPGEHCNVSAGPKIGVHCPLPADGVFRVLLFAGRERFGTYSHIGTFEAVSQR